MPKITGPFWVYKRPKTKKFQVTLYSVSGLPPEICKNWKRKGFSRFPQELAVFREPKTKAAAEAGALALIEYLKSKAKQPVDTCQMLQVSPQDSITIGAWLERFISLENNPRASRLTGKKRPYSPGTIAMYKGIFRLHIKGDPFLNLLMADTGEEDALAFTGRLGLRPNKYGKPLDGTRTYTIVIKFIRMAFAEYGKTHKRWINPFIGIEPPIDDEENPPEAIEEWEIVKLFAPGVITDPLQKAVCAAIFWAGLRRSEIFGLKPEDLDWQTPRLNIRHAWKQFNRKERILGDPKWHKKRTAPFPDILQIAIKELWAAYGQHEFVFCRKDGSLPRETFLRWHLPRWLKQAGIELNGRKIVPHSARHSIASALEAKGVPLRYIGDMLGHSSLKTTRGYLHTVSGAINDMGSKIDGMAQGAEKEEEKTG
jgi:site-specific recombinase XerD